MFRSEASAGHCHSAPLRHSFFGVPQVIQRLSSDQIYTIASVHWIRTVSSVWIWLFDCALVLEWERMIIWASGRERGKGKDESKKRDLLPRPILVRTRRNMCSFGWRFPFPASRTTTLQIKPIASLAKKFVRAYASNLSRNVCNSTTSWRRFIFWNIRR